MRSRSAFTSLLALSAAACAQPAAAPPPSPVVMVDTVTVTRVDTVRVEVAAAANPELQDRLGRLQIQVLEKDVQIRDLEDQLETTRLELGEWMAHARLSGAPLVVGIEAGFTGGRYIRHRLGQEWPEVRVQDTLEATCREAVTVIERKRAPC